MRKRASVIPAIQRWLARVQIRKGVLSISGKRKPSLKAANDETHLCAGAF